MPSKVYAAFRPTFGSNGRFLSALAIILDCSGSMKDRTKEGPTKMEAAKEGAPAAPPPYVEFSLQSTVAEAAK